jgi:ureidoglycolate lyase
MTTLTTHRITARPLTPEAFEPYGAVLAATEDGAPFSEREALLDLSRGTPRFYVMALVDKPPVFTGITRHRAVTQTLAAVGGRPWLLAVAPPHDVDVPDAHPALDDITAFHIPGDVAVLLHRGTWHSGPFFDGEQVPFFDLELADTNQVDHHTYRLDRELGLRCEVVVPA